MRSMANRHRVLGWVALVLVLGCAGGGGRPEWFPDPGFGRPDWETKDDLTEGPEARKNFHLGFLTTRGV